MISLSTHCLPLTHCLTPSHYLLVSLPLARPAHYLPLPWVSSASHPISQCLSVHSFYFLFRTHSFSCSLIIPLSLIDLSLPHAVRRVSLSLVLPLSRVRYHTCFLISLVLSLSFTPSLSLLVPLSLVLPLIRSLLPASHVLSPLHSLTALSVSQSFSDPHTVLFAFSCLSLGFSLYHCLVLSTPHSLFL